MSKTEYAYTTGTVGEAIATYNYTYGNAWKDQLTAFGGSAITYDAAGNPTSYLGKTLTWSRGRLLTKYVSGSRTVDMQYDANGLRISKSRKIASNTLNSTYIYDSQGKLRIEIAGNITRNYIYGQDGIVGYEESGEHFMYRKNFFGDIVAIYQGTTKIAEYSYDAWGNCTIVSDYNGYGARNPFRYRGYYFDTDLNMYYLMTRYYDPQTGRFINADTIEYLDPKTINGLNLYAYCGDNPIMYVDPTGHFLITLGVIAFFAFAAVGAALLLQATVVVTGILLEGVVNLAITIIADAEKQLENRLEFIDKSKKYKEYIETTGTPHFSSENLAELLQRILEDAINKNSKYYSGGGGGGDGDGSRGGGGGRSFGDTWIDRMFDEIGYASIE